MAPPGAESPSPELPTPILRRSSISRYFGAYAGSFVCSPVWYGIGVMFLELLPAGMTLSAVIKLQTDQFGQDSYWIVNNSKMLQSVLSLPAVALCGYLSQPHRFGRKRVLLCLACFSTVLNAIPVITLNAYVITLAQTVMSCLGCCSGSAANALFPIVIAWTTDWCKPENKMSYFGIIMGAMFGGISIGPILPALLHIQTPSGIFMLAATMKLAGPMCIALLFPASVPSLGPITPSSLARRFSASPRFLSTPEPAESRLAGGSRKKMCKHICSSLAYMFKSHPSATLIYSMVSFCDTAVQDSVAVFLTRERGFTQDDLNALISVIGMSGFVAQCFVMPVVNACGAEPCVVLLIAVLAMVAHFCCYAFLSNKLLLILSEPAGALGYAAIISATTIISGESKEDEPPRDQGTLMGSLAGLKTLASIVGPLVLAGSTSNWKRFPKPLDWPGVGFAFLALVMVLATFLAMLLCCKRIRRKSSLTC